MPRENINGFNDRDAARIGKVVRRVEKTPVRRVGNRRHRHGVAGGGANTFPVPVQITAQVAYNKYTVDVFGDGRFEDDGTPYVATVEDATLWIYNIATSETIPNATWVMAVPVDGHYEGQVPIWL